MDKILNQKWIVALLLIFLIGDLAYSFVQHYHHPLDGDMAPVIVPADWYKPVLEDRFGISVLTEGKEYASTNRHFANYSMYKYYRTVPNLLQSIINPIKSVYLAGALFKIVIQFLLIAVLCAYVLPNGNIFSKQGLLIATLIYPLFQTEGFNSFIGIIDHSPTYTFFYALPMLGILWFFLPYYKKYFHQQHFKVWWMFPLLLLSIYLSFHGPLNAPVVILTVGLMVLALLFNNFKNEGSWTAAIQSMQIPYLIIPILFVLMCLYSFYIGTFNLEGKDMAKPLTERYIILLKALPFYFTNKLGLPLLIIAIIINCFIIFKLNKIQGANKLLQLFVWLAAFSLIYLVLLPLGGYRNYRPMIIRHDTFLPITLILMFTFASSTYFILNHLKSFKIYIAFIALVLIIFTVADEPKLNRKDCEHHALIKIANATEPVVRLEENCGVMSWFALTYPEGSDINIKLLKFWNIVDKEKQIQYYH